MAELRTQFTIRAPTISDTGYPKLAFLRFRAA